MNVQIANIKEFSLEELEVFSIQIDREIKARIAKNNAIFGLREDLQKGICYFSYQKINGEIRTAIGTLNQAVIQSIEGGKPKASRKKQENAECFCYFDIEARDWRCFKKQNYKGLTAK